MTGGSARSGTFSLGRRLPDRRPVVPDLQFTRPVRSTERATRRADVLDGFRFVLAPLRHRGECQVVFDLALATSKADRFSGLHGIAPDIGISPAGRSPAWPPPPGEQGDCGSLP